MIVRVSSVRNRLKTLAIEKYYDDHIILPGHFERHSNLVSIDDPTQWAPPRSGNGELHDRVLFTVEPPHGLLHELH